jgi:hypothetical protein
MKQYTSRWGRFKITGPLFETIRHGGPDTEAFKSVMALMSQIFIVEARHHPFEDSVEYMGISPLFDEVKEGEVAPEYMLEGVSSVEELPDGSHSYKYEVKSFKRIKGCPRCGSMTHPWT